MGVREHQTLLDIPSSPESAGQLQTSLWTLPPLRPTWLTRRRLGKESYTSTRPVPLNHSLTLYCPVSSEVFWKSQAWDTS